MMRVKAKFSLWACALSLSCGGARSEDVPDVPESAYAGDAGDAGGAGDASTSPPEPFEPIEAIVPFASPSVERRLGFGRHPLAATAHGAVFALTSGDPTNARARLTLVDVDLRGATKSAVSTLVSEDAALAANPVVGVLPDGRVVVAWNERDGEGASLMLGLVVEGRVVSRLRVGAEGEARDADLWVRGSDVDLLFVDDLAPTGPDVGLASFTASSDAEGAEDGWIARAPLRIIADAEGAESNPILADRAMAWTERTLDRTRLVVRDGDVEWRTDAFVDGPTTSRPALLALDTDEHSRWLAVFVVARTDEDDDVLGHELRAVVLDPRQPGLVESRALELEGVVDPRDPSLARVGAVLHLAFGTADDVLRCALAIDERVDEPHARCIAAPTSIPQAAAHRLGAQRLPELLAVPLADGVHLLAAWDDHARTFGTAVAPLDVAYTVFSR